MVDPYFSPRRQIVPASTVTGRPDLTPFLTAEERATARTYGACLERELRTQLAKRLKRLRAQFADRPLKTAGARAWLLTLSAERLALFADLTTFEAAALALPPPEGACDWQSGLAVADAYPAGIPDSCTQMYHYLFDLRALAQERRSAAPRPGGTQPAEGGTDTAPAGRRGRRTVRRPAAGLG
ncbi:hypothetical protein ACFVZ3_06600 [Kitasatospora purpeofusca]|uniref:hypothetical protein n=1 Tax=Kitasatospora purpeofusca TaxID=67352 RepID=UPI0036C9C06E